jgi:hypothetical protein
MATMFTLPNRDISSCTTHKMFAAHPKTPFKIPLNDENGQIRGGKSALKTNGQKSAFVTPAGT